ncbi:hypothetical protein SY88_05545 [Clostridiales bacterium PH28_bin88]|nr:hypothetical protein SY88_05545 [Clostridiales bacterium PH28_bin88]
MGFKRKLEVNIFQLVAEIYVLTTHIKMVIFAITLRFAVISKLYYKSKRSIFVTYWWGGKYQLVI